MPLMVRRVCASLARVYSFRRVLRIQQGVVYKDLRPGATPTTWRSHPQNGTVVYDGVGSSPRVSCSPVQDVKSSVGALTNCSGTVTGSARSRALASLTVATDKFVRERCG